MIYLDNAATTLYKPPEVGQAMLDALQTAGNPGRGAHAPTLHASRIVYETREALAQLFHAEGPACIAFASNATQALNTAINGLFGPGDHVITTVCEHNSVLRPLYRLQRQGGEVSFVDVDANSELCYAQFEQLLRPNTRGVVVTGASNVTGNRTDLAFVSAFAKKHGLLFGTSICYTSANYKAVTSDEFMDMLISHGVRFNWYFHYMPIGDGANVDLMLNAEQREYMIHRVREIRGYTGGKPIFCIDFQNDGEYIDGCIAGGRQYAHINPAGDVEPCVFIHYSGANIREKSFLECLQQPLFLEYRKGQPFNGNHLRPCPMLENPDLLPEMVRRSGARSTDLEAPESAEHLCEKCKVYAACWQPTAEQLWDEEHRQ